MSAETQNLIEKSLVGQIINGLNRNKTSWTVYELQATSGISPNKIGKVIRLISDNGAGILNLRRSGRTCYFDVSKIWTLEELKKYFNNPPCTLENLGVKSEADLIDDTI